MHFKNIWQNSTSLCLASSLHPVIDAGEVGFLEALEMQERRELEAMGRVRRYSPGESIFQQGDPSDFLVVIKKGYTRVVEIGPDGTRVILRLCGADEILGEVSVLDGKPRSATVEVLGEVEAIVIPASQVNAFLHQHPEVLKRITLTLIYRLRSLSTRYREFVSETVDARVAKALLDYAKTFGVTHDHEVLLSLTQQNLSEIVGSSREAVVKTLRALRAQGLIGTKRGKIVLLDRDGLQLQASQKDLF